MKKDKETKKRRFKAGNGSLAFYIMAVIFLLLGIYAAFVVLQVLIAVGIV